MRKRIYLIASLVLVGFITKANAESNNEVEIDLNNDTLVSTDGVNVKYGELKLKAFNLNRDTKNNKAYINGDFYLQADEPTGQLKVDSRDGVFSLDGNTGSFGRTFGYLEVGQVTGAEKPNDRIYFGGDRAEYENGTVYLKNGWFTTDPKIMTVKNPMEVGYHLSSELITIEPDKQITFKNSDLYIGDNDVIPFTFPWYRVNIRQGSKVPLFPMWGTDQDLGWNISWGALYGNRDSKFRGGFAPKFGDKAGFMVGRWENWYKTDKFGESRLNVTDWLVKKKHKNITSVSDFDRWDVDYSHNYSGEYGDLNFNYRNATYNMIPQLKDVIRDYDREGKLKKNNWKYVNGIPNFGGNIGFYSLDTNLKNLGENKDITIKAKTKLVSDKKAYGLLVADNLDDLGYGAQADYDLYSDVSVKKENKRYVAGGYYKYLYDMDPGSTTKDLQSRAEDFGFNFNDKVYNYGFNYDEKNGDKFRKLNSWERDPNLSSIGNLEIAGIPVDYTPWTVSQYDVYDSRNLNLYAGDYKFIGDSTFKTNYDYNYFEHKLNLDNDPLREKTILNNKREQEYNRFENIIYNKYRENKGSVNFNLYNSTLTLGGGETKEEIWDREGIYNYPEQKLGYRKYINESKFYEMGLGQRDINLGYLGNLDLNGNLRFDEYTKGYTNDQLVSTNDGSRRTQFGLTHRINLYDNSNNRDRIADINLDNQFKYFYQDYSYDSGDKNNFNKDLRMRHKENKNVFGDVVTFGLGNTETKYTIDYSESKRASNNKKTAEVMKHKVDFKIDEKSSLGLEYGKDKRYTDGGAFRDIINKNYNDLTFENYGVNYTYLNNNFYYKGQKIDSNLIDGRNLPEKYRYDAAKEKIKENTYGYTYTFNEDKLNLEYTEGRDNRDNLSTHKKEIDSKNKIYTVSYLDGGDVEHFYKASYEDYNRQGNADIEKWNSDVIYLRYDYRDKRFSDQELMAYASSEYNKRPDQLTSNDIARIRQILNDRANNRESTRFNLNGIMDNRVYFGDYKRSFSSSLMLQRNDRRYEQTGDYLKSLEKVEARVFYSYDRIGFGYKYDQNAEFSGGNKSSNWKDTEREHELSFHAKFGRPSEGWRFKSYIKFLDNLQNNSTGINDGRRTLDGLGVEVGKEFGYYEWSVGYLREYSYSTRDYEWQVALQFKLLTFPEMNIFGLGATTDTGTKKTSPDTYLFNGLKVDDID